MPITTEVKIEDESAIIRNLTKTIGKDLKENKRKGFKSNNRVYRKVFNKVLRQSRSIDPFGGDYFCINKEDATIPICITLPRSLVEEVNKYCKKKKVTRSRLLRKIIIYSLNLQESD